VREICLALIVCTGVAASEPRANPAAGEFADFDHRVKQYVKLHKDLEKKLPPLKDKATKEEIATHQKALAQALKRARTGVRQGNLITPATKKQFAVLLAEALKGRQNADVRKTVKEGNPEFPTSTDPEVKDIKLVVNAEYPKEASASTMPAAVLEKLPKLPEELEYRFVGRDLIIRDTVADTIVDFAVKVAPI
jgi:hypothetical protein